MGNKGVRWVRWPRLRPAPTPGTPRGVGTRYTRGGDSLHAGVGTRGGDSLLLYPLRVGGGGVGARLIVSVGGGNSPTLRSHRVPTRCEPPSSTAYALRYAHNERRLGGGFV